MFQQLINNRISQSREFRIPVHTSLDITVVTRGSTDGLCSRAHGYSLFRPQMYVLIDPHPLLHAHLPLLRRTPTSRWSRLRVPNYTLNTKISRKPELHNFLLLLLFLN